MKTLSQCIAVVESSNRFFASRFEPALYASDPQWIRGQEGTIMKFNGCDLQTAQAIACTSYGFFQLLGANIYSLGYSSNIFNFVCGEVESQYPVFSNFIKPRGFNPDQDMSQFSETDYVKFATFYNGPSAVEQYVSAMKENSD